MNVSQNCQTCFISAPPGVDTAPLRQALDNRGIAWIDVGSAKPKGSILETIESAIALSDFAIAVVTTESNLPRSAYNSVFFEAGIARGRGCPVLVFIEPDVDVPPQFQYLVYARTNLQNYEALNFHLDVFLQHAGSKPVGQGSPSFSSALKLGDRSWALEALALIETLSVEERGFEFEKLVAQILERSGAVVSRAPAASKGEGYMAIWIDEVQSIFGNPILVTTKCGQFPETELEGTQVRLREEVIKVRARAGLLIYWHPNGKEFTHSLGGLPPTIRIGINQSIDSLARGQFIQVLLNNSLQVA